MYRAKILLLGDSISMGYREYVCELLSNKCDVVFPQENGKSASHTHRMLWEWQAEVRIGKSADLIYWNNGLWDVVRIYGDEQETSVDAYGKYLQRIFNRLRTIYPKAKIVFACTTPVREELYSKDFFRKNCDIEQYNAKAKEVLAGSVDSFDDLHDFAKSSLADKYKDATHFNEAGNRMLATHIVEVIKNIIGLRIVDYSAWNCARMSWMRRKSEEIASNNLPVVLWGAGDCFENYIEILKPLLNIVKVIDSNPMKQGKILHGISCIPPQEAGLYAKHVIAMIYDDHVLREVALNCERIGLECVSFSVFAESVLSEMEAQLVKKQFPNGMKDCAHDCVDQMKKYIGIDIPAYDCNFACSYCYLSQREKNIFHGFPRFPHNPEYLRMQLRRERVGGSALIGLCGWGETLLCDQITQISSELLKEGHYLHIVTNGTVFKKIKEIISVAGEYASHVFFKLSFHYMELQKHGLLEKFAESVDYIDKSEASYTIELMPHDELIPYIPEIMEFSMKHFGAYPQLTIGRDDMEGGRLLTRYNFDEYYKIWKVFQSEMFETRMKLYMMHGKGCRVGEDAFFIDAYTGRIHRCLFPETVGNIYSHNGSLDFEGVGDSCPLEYCYNCHVYATLGCIPAVSAPTYFSIRDRKKLDGTHWIKDKMREFLDIKLYELNASRR